MAITNDIETAKVKELIAMIGDGLVKAEVGGDLNAIKSLICKDFTNSSFARGFMLGAGSILNCGGLPVFLSDHGARELQIRLMAIAKEFKIVGLLKDQGAVA